MKILLLMGNTKSKSENSKVSVFLTEFDGKILLQHQLEKCKVLKPLEYLFYVSQESITEYKFNLITEHLISKYTIINLHGITSGAICTAMLGVDHLDENEEIIILAGDEFINENYADIVTHFKENKADCGIVNFQSMHPRYSYMISEENGNIIEIAEKNPLSKDALASFYYFKKSSSFINAAKKVIKKDRKIHERFYVSQVINEMILENEKIINYPIDSNHFIPLKTKSQIAKK